MHTRPQHYRAIFGPWWGAVNLLWFLLSSADTLVGKYGAPEFKQAWDASWVAPRWGWGVWVIGVAVITAIFAVEYSYRYIKKHEKDLEAERAKNVGSRIEGEITHGYLDFRRFADDGQFPFMASGCTATFYVEAVNHNDTPAMLRADKSSVEFAVQMGIQKKTFHGVWDHIRPNVLAVDDETVKDNRVLDFFDVWKLLTKGYPASGHMGFLVEGFDQSFAFGKQTVDAEVVITIVDTLSKSHILRASLPLRVGTMYSLQDRMKKTPI